jgi:hypothetical protein
MMLKMAGLMTSKQCYAPTGVSIHADNRAAIAQPLDHPVAARESAEPVADALACGRRRRCGLGQNAGRT